MLKKVTSLLLIATLLDYTSIYAETKNSSAISESAIKVASQINTISTITPDITQAMINIQEQAKKKLEEDKKRKEIEKENYRKENVRVYKDDISIVSNITEEELNQIFDLKGKPQMKKLSNAFIDSEKQYGINAFTLVAIVAQESAWAKEPGGNGSNFTGYCIHYGVESKGSQFSGGYYNILETARLLKEDYINPNGKYYCGGKSIYDINKYYCLTKDKSKADYTWGDFIINIQNDLEKIYHKQIKTLE
jgi:beta-N-acetylglucosaminidase